MCNLTRSRERERQRERHREREAEYIHICVRLWASMSGFGGLQDDFETPYHGSSRYSMVCTSRERFKLVLQYFMYATIRGHLIRHWQNCRQDRWDRKLISSSM